MITTGGWIAIGIGAVIVVVGAIAIFREWLDMQDAQNELERMQYNKFQYDNHTAFEQYNKKE
jgi:cytochrome c oxidase assembly factor CtaG